MYKNMSNMTLIIGSRFRVFPGAVLDRPPYNETEYAAIRRFVELGSLKEEKPAAAAEPKPAPAPAPVVEEPAPSPAPAVEEQPAAEEQPAVEEEKPSRRHSKK